MHRRAGVSPSCISLRLWLFVVGDHSCPANTDVVFYLLILIQGSLQDTFIVSCFFIFSWKLFHLKLHLLHSIYMFIWNINCWISNNFLINIWYDPAFIWMPDFLSYSTWLFYFMVIFLLQCLLLISGYRCWLHSISHIYLPNNVVTQEKGFFA